jgi:nucleoside-diphosphate-sugar epimerase
MQLFDSVKKHYLNQESDGLKLLFEGQPVEMDVEALKEGLQNRLSWAKADICDTDALVEAFSEEIDAVFHCAAMVSFKRKDRNAMMENNIQGTANVVNTCLKLGIANLIHVSSVAALSRKEGSDIITADSEWEESKYNTDYAISKYYSELEAWRGKEEGLNVGVVNPGIILGVGNGNTPQNQFIGIVNGGNPFVPVGGNGFVWVDDLCLQMIGMLEQKTFGKRQLAVSHNLTYISLFNNLAKLLGKKAPSIRMEGLVYKILIGITSVFDFLRIPFPISKALVVSTSKRSVYIF